MDVVRHQAVAEQAHAGAGGLVAQQPAIAVAVVVVEKGWLAVVAPLSEVMRFAHRHHPRESGHRIAALSAYHSFGSLDSKVVACPPLSLSPTIRWAHYRIRIESSSSTNDGAGASGGRRASPDLISGGDDGPGDVGRQGAERVSSFGERRAAGASRRSGSRPERVFLVVNAPAGRSGFERALASTSAATRGPIDGPDSVEQVDRDVGPLHRRMLPLMRRGVWLYDGDLRGAVGFELDDLDLEGRS